MDGDTNLTEDSLRMSDIPANIPNLLLINADVINPMKVVFETAGQVICNKNERLTVDNSDKHKVMINIEVTDDIVTNEKEKVKARPIRSKSKPDLKTSENGQISKILEIRKITKKSS